MQPVAWNGRRLTSDSTHVSRDRVRVYNGTDADPSRDCIQSFRSSLSFGLIGGERFRREYGVF